MNSNKKFIKYTSGITALALALTLSTGCSNTSKFKLTQNEKGEYIAAENSYIDNKNISTYCVIETYSNITNESKIYIAYRDTKYYNTETKEYYYKYINVFNNTRICFDNNSANDNIIFIKENPLIDYLNSYDMVKERYTYEDMQKVYETILVDYKFGDPSLEQSSTNNALIKKRTLV